MARRRSRGSKVSRKRSRVSRKRSKVSRKRSKVSRKRSRVSRKRSRVSRTNRTRRYKIRKKKSNMLKSNISGGSRKTLNMIELRVKTALEEWTPLAPRNRGGTGREQGAHFMLKARPESGKRGSEDEDVLFRGFVERTGGERFYGRRWPEVRNAPEYEYNTIDYEVSPVQ
jgi:hypothetical protein